MTQAEARTYFEDYAAAFDKFDAKAIADFLHAPCTIVGQDYLLVLATHSDIVDNFSAVNRMHQELGYHHALLVDCAVYPAYSDKHLEARTLWRFLRQDGSPIYSFRMIYFLGRFEGTWKIVVALNLDEAQSDLETNTTLRPGSA